MLTAKSRERTRRKEEKNIGVNPGEGARKDFYYRCGSHSNRCMSNFYHCRNHFNRCVNDFYRCGNDFLACVDDFLACGNDFLVCVDDFLACGNDFLVCVDDFLACGNHFLVCVDDFLACGNHFKHCVSYWRREEVEPSLCSLWTLWLKKNGENSAGRGEREGARQNFPKWSCGGRVGSGILYIYLCEGGRVSTLDISCLIPSQAHFEM
jgi:hypothetical protein